MPFDDTAHYEDQSPTLLAMEPLEAKPPEEMPDWGALYHHNELRLNSLRNWRWTWWYVWMQLAEFFLPRRAKAWVVANNMTRGRYLNDAIIDTTGSMAALQCGAGMWSGLTNPARAWFKFGPAIDNTKLSEQSKLWLETTGNRAMAVLHQSNFYSTMAQFFQDMVVFGTSPIIIYEDAVDVIRCFLPCAGEYFLGAGSRFSVDTLYREFTLTILQMVEMFGLRNCPPQVQMLWGRPGVLDQEFLIAHAIEPNFAVRKGRGSQRASILSGKFVYRETYWVRGQKNIAPLSLRGFYEKPFMAGRWTIVSNDPYGRGPGIDALGDQKQVQQETRRKAEFIEKGVRPPMIADPEMKNEPASIMPGQVTFVNTANGKKGFEPAFEVNAQWLQHLVVDIQGVNQRIQNAFYIPQFMAITQMAGVQPRNELELTKRDLERLQVLGPVIDLFESEVASPALERVVNIMLRRGMLDPMPPELRGMPLKITFESLARQAQRAAASVSMKDGFVTGGQLSAAAKAAGVPDPLRVVNLDESYRYYLELNNYPRSCIFTADEVHQHDQIRQEEIAKAKQEEQLAAATKPTVDAAKVLSQTQVPGDNALAQMMTGNVQGGQ